MILFECLVGRLVCLGGLAWARLSRFKSMVARFARMQLLLTLIEGTIFHGCTQRLKD